MSTRCRRRLAALAALDRPTIAAIEGSAIGGGLAVALVLRPAFRRRRRASRGAAGQARPGLRPGRDEPARRAGRPGARQGSAVQRPPRRAGRSAGDRPRRPRRAGRRARTERSSDYAAELAELSQRSIRGAKRIVDALAAGLALDSPTLRADVRPTGRRTRPKRRGLCGRSRRPEPALDPRRQAHRRRARRRPRARQRRAARRGRGRGARRRFPRRPRRLRRQARAALHASQEQDGR